MDQNEFIKYVYKVDPIDLMIRADEAKKYLNEGKVDDALAYALAAGVKLGVKAVLDNIGSDKEE